MTRSEIFEERGASTPRLGRGGRRFKSCHSDHHLAEIKILTGTDCGTVSGDVQTALMRSCC
jgi:hypothetical protein